MADKTQNAPWPIASQSVPGCCRVLQCPFPTGNILSLKIILFLAVGDSKDLFDELFGIIALLFGLIQSFLMYDTLVTSQKLVDTHQDLLKKLEFSKTEGWTIHEDPNMALFVKHLEMFDGFTAKDYFTLNKTCLTSIGANFVTYFIILIQFQQSSDSK